MPVALPIATLAAGAIAAGATAYGAHETSNASKDAAQLQSAYNTKALAAAQEQRDYQRQQQNQYLTRLAPYAATYAPSMTRLNGLLDPSNVGMPSNAVPAATPAPAAVPAATPAPAAVPAATQTGMVTLRAPNGQTKQVPATQAGYFTSKGATLVTQ